MVLRSPDGRRLHAWYALIRPVRSLLRMDAEDREPQRYVDSVFQGSERKDLPRVLLAWKRRRGNWRSATQAQRRALIVHAWKLGLAPQRCIPARRWLRLFKSVGQFVDHSSATFPTEGTQLYRGCTPGGERGMSWSAEGEVAERLGGRGERNAIMVTTIAPAKAVLAVLVTAGEHEYVLSPRWLSRRARIAIDGPAA